MFGNLATKLALRKAGLGDIGKSFSAFTASAPPATTPDGKEIVQTESDWKNSNPFAKITVPKSLVAWQNPPPVEVEMGAAPEVGTRAPSASGLMMPYTGAGGRGKAAVIVFLRCCGCPFAEQTFLNMRALANKYPSVPFIAISHCTSAATTKWLTDLGGAWNVTIINDPSREIYAKWGLGVGNTWHVLNPWTQVAQRKLGNEGGIWAREAGEGGNRWVIGGAWAVDAEGVVRWGGRMKTADDLPNLGEGVEKISR